jgi:uncharacterized sodium:solute symporter family permease YidK
MKATAIALIVLSVYWVEQGITAIKQDDTTNGVGLIVMGIVLLPIAKYVWGKNLGPKT